MKCQTCGLANPACTFCSATSALTCQGRDPVPGCGAILTAQERHYYGDCCDECEGRWCYRLQAWRGGADDPELDRKYGVPKVLH